MITKPLDVPGLAELLGVSTKWIYQQCRARRIPHSKIAGQIRFTEEHVHQILADGEQAPIAAPTQPVRLRRIA